MQVVGNNYWVCPLVVHAPRRSNHDAERRATKELPPVYRPHIRYDFPHPRLAPSGSLSILLL